MICKRQMKNKQDIIKDLNRLTAFIEQTHTKLSDGTVESLSHLDSEVEVLCRDIIALPPLDAQSVQPMMADMISRLEALGIALQEFQTKLKGV